MPDKCLRKTGFDCQGPVLMEKKIKGSSFCTIMYRQDICFHCMAPTLEYIFASDLQEKLGMRMTHTARTGQI